MTAPLLYALCGVLLFAISFYGFVAAEHLVRKVIALNIMSGGVFLVVIALATRSKENGLDPVPQAIVLTGIVVGLSATALALALIRRFYEETGATRLPPPTGEEHHDS